MLHLVHWGRRGYGPPSPGFMCGRGDTAYGSSCVLEVGGAGSIGGRRARHRVVPVDEASLCVTGKAWSFLAPECAFAVVKVELQTKNSMKQMRVVTPATASPTMPPVLGMLPPPLILLSAAAALESLWTLAAAATESRHRRYVRACDRCDSPFFD
ncbi:hypothetical protein B0H14DRAFT_3570760, partial [Mycena olivaceomarginata]